MTFPAAAQAATSVKVKFASTFATWYLDDVKIVSAESAATPTLTLSGATGLGALKTTTGYQGETAGYFTVKGENLTAKVTVTAPTGFVVCGSENGTYASSIDITAANAMASAGAKVYVKMSSSASGTYNSKSVTVASSGATSKTQSVSGTTYAAPGLSSTSGSASVTQGDIPEVTVSDYKTGSGTMTYSIKTAPAGVASSAYDISASSGWLVFDTDGVDPGTYTFVVQVQNAAADTHGTETYTWAVTVTSSAADCWICLETSANGTYYVGDSLASGWWVNWQVNGGWDDGWMKTWVGWQTSGDGYTEYTASWYADDGSNKKVHSDIGGYTFKVAQPHYIIAQGQRTASGPAAADATPGTSWTDSSAWPPDGLNTGTAHFTVNAIPVPASMNAATGDAAGKVQLSWTKNTPGHNVMVVRYASGATPTAPTDGTAYAQNASIGSGKVVYNGSGTSYGNTGLTAGTTYDYYFYSVNNNYYSTGTKKSATAAKAPTFAEGSVTKTTTTGTKVSNSQTATGVPSSMTYSGTCTAGGATAGNGTTAGTFNVNSSSGDFNFTPGAAGSYSFTVTANNGVTPNGTYTIAVTVKPVALTLGAAAGASPGTVTLTVSGREGDATLNVRRYESSSDASSDTTGTGGEQVTAANANGTFTDSGLDGCKTYYYKAWQTHNGQTSAATDTKSAKTALATPDVWSTADDGSITLNWPPVKGAVNYTVEIATDDTFATASAGTLLSMDFEAGTPTTGWTIGGQSNSDHAQSGKCRQLTASTEIVTPVVNNPAQISFYVNMSSGGKNKTYYVYYADPDDDNWSNSMTFTTESSAKTVTLDFPANVGEVEICIASGYSSIYIDNIVVTGSSGGGTMMDGYPATVAQVAAGVTNVSHSLSGLTNGVTYSYRVTANGGESCETTSSIGHEEPTAATPTMGVTVGGSGVAYDGTVAFGNVGVGSPQTKTFTVANTGSGTLTLGTVGVTAGQGFTVTGPESGSVAGSGSTTFTVTFTPTAEMIGAGQKSATVSFTHNDGEKTTPYRFTVTASATGGILAVDESAGGLAFGNTPLDSPKTETVTIRNTGNVALTVGSVSVSGTGFSLVSAWSSQSIAAGGSATVSVRFAPASAGGKSGTLTVTASGAASGSPATVALTGTGINETTGNIWIKPLTTGNQGTKTVGDTMGEHFLNFEIGQSSWNKSEVGIGLSTGTVWGDFDWADAGYYEEGEKSGNKRVRRDLAGFQFTQVGQYNVIYAAKNAAGDNSTVRCAGDWVNYTTWLPTDFGATYFTVEPVPDPAVTSATAGYETVALRWSLDAASHPVMIVRYTGATPTVTAPTPGQHYESGATIGAGTVVYREWAGTSVDTAVAQGTTYTYVLYSVNNGYYSAGARTTVASSSVSTPSVTVTDAGSGTLTGGDSGVTYVVARNTTGTFDTNPTGSGPNQGGTLGTGANAATVVYRGTAATFTDTTVVGCNTYYYKVWAKAASEDAWSAGSGVANATIATPAAPVLNAIAAGTTTHNQFVATWSAVPGAAKYRLDVYTGGAGSSKTDTMTSAWTGSTTSGSYASWSDKSDQSGAVYAGATAGGNSSIQMNVNTDHGIWTTTSGGTVKKVTVTWYSGTSSGRSILIYGSHSAMSSPVDGTQVGSIVCGTSTEYTFTTDYEYVGMTGSGGGASYASQIEVEWEKAGSITYVAGYEDKDVGNVTTYTVTGLDEQTTYHVKVRAEGANSSCTSGDSNVEDVTTKEDTTVTDVTISDADGAGNDSAVAAGAVAAGQTVLVQGTKLAVASGSVNPTLTGVTFTTTGTAGTGDLATYQVRVGTSATFAGTETVKGTVTAGAAGSHTVTFGSAQTLTAGQTYYVWIEAVTKAGASGGNTVGVAALTKDAFATTGARKNGETSATGLQTIGNLTAFSAATGASAGGQVDLTWTAGAGGSVLVRWSDVSLAAIPDPGTAWANEATGLTGGSYTVSGVTGCKTHYFKAWEVIGGVACGTARTGTAAASAPAAPTGLGHGTPGAHNATLTWAPAAGAAGYAIDLWHYEGGSGSETKTDELTIETLGVTSVNAYSGFSGVQAADGSDAVYAGEVAKASSDNGSGIQQNAKSGNERGIWTTTSGGTLKSVSVDWFKNANSYKVYGKTSGTFDGTSTSGATQIGTLTYASPSTGDISESGYVAVLIVPSGGASYANSITIEWEGGSSGTKVDDVIGGVVQAGSAVTVAANGATGVTLGGLTEATGYGWKVTALGDGGCTGGTSGSDSFSTAELLGAPTVTAWTGPGAGQVTGTVTRAAGATVTLKRYASREDALADANGSVVATVATESATLVAFDDTGLAGCATHWYRAWQSAAVEGTPTTSAGSEPASAEATLGAPSVSPAGAGTALTLSWTPVPGADYYTVLVSDTEGVWTSSSSDGSAVLEQDFAGFTSTTTADVGENLDSYTGLSGWYGGKVYPNSGSAKLGSGSATGFITTRRIAGGLANGGTVYFDLMDYGDGTTVSVQICLDDGDDDAENDEWTELKSVEPGSSWQTFQASLPSGNTDFWICFETTKKRVYIDNIRVVPTVPSGSGSGKVGLKYQTTVTEAPWSRTVDGLEVGETYWYMVTAWSDGGCTNATGGSAATADVPQLAAVPKRYDFRTLERDESAEKTFTLRNSGSRLNPATTPALEIASIAVVPSGIGYTVVSGGAAATLEPGQTHSVTVRFAPVTAGTKDAVLRVTCNAYNANPEGTVAAGKTFDIPLAGECHDPSTEPPTVFTVDVEDGLGIEDTIADHSLALGTPDGTGGELPGAKRPELKVVLWHYNGIWTNLTGAKAATWTLKDPEGTAVLSGQAFTGVVARTYGGKSCMEFSAAVPALGAEGAVRGAYTVEVSAWDATKTHEVPAAAAGTYTPAEKGWLLDDFTRADRKGDGLGALEEGWVAQSTDSTPGSAAIHGGALELWGPYGDRSGEDGRAAAVRDMSDWGYEKNPEDMASAVSWGFHFRMGGEPVNFTDGSTAGAFVLGAAGSGFFANDTAQKGYAVTMTGAGIELVRFSKGWIESGTRTVLVPRTKNGSGAWVEDGTKPHGWTGTFAGKTLAVRVDFLPGQEYIEDVQDEVPARMKLFVKEVASTGGNPLEECTDADLAATVHLAGGDLIGESLPYAGAVWNHGHDTTAGGSDKKWGLFDDFHFPCQKGQEIPSVVHVIDEDTEAPELEGFDIGGAVAAATAASAGLSFTGMVHDASGIWTGGAKAPGWTLTVDDTERASGTFASAGIVPSGDGAGTDVALSGSIPASAFDAAWRTTNCVVTVRAWDHDRDRAGDSLEGTAEFRFTLCDEAPVAPAWATAEADGAEMVVLRWARTAGKTYVVVRSDEEIAEDAAPQGRLEALAEGTTVEGWGKVVYNGTGDNHLAGTWTAREFVVAPGSSNYFAVYGMTGDGTTGHFFSTPVHPTAYHWTTSTTNAATGAVTVTDHTAVDGSGVPVAGAVEEGGWPCTTAKYEPGEGVDAFAYRTSVPEIGDTDPQNLALAFNYETRPETGSGWGGPWTGDTDKWKLHDASLPVGETRYPAPAANKLYWQDTSTGSRDEAKLTRALASPNGGTFFVAAILNYDEPHPETGAESKWIQIVLQDASGNDIVSFGKPGWDSINAAIEYDGGQYAGFDPFELYSGHGNDYIVVGQVDRNAGKFRMWAYYAGAGQIPEIFSKKVEGRDEEVSFDTLPTAMNSFVADCDFSGTPAPVAKIQLRAGSESGKELGHVYFDEVRFASTWEELFLFNAPEVESFDFDKPDAGSGIMVGEDADGHRLWKISDGALAHGDVGLNAQFELYHRTGIAAASFTIKDEEGNSLLRPAEWRATTTNAQTGAVTTNDTRAGTGGAPVAVHLDGARDSAYPEWWTTNAAGRIGGAVGVAVPTNWISTNATYTVEVKMTSIGGKEATVTAASETGGGGASDLFFGEYGEGRYWDKYIELYNGTGHDIDLYDYYIFRPANASSGGNDFSATYDNLIPNGTHPFARICPEENPSEHVILHHKETIVLLNNKMGASGDDLTIRNNRLAALKTALTQAGARYILMTNEVLDAGGKVPYLLVKAEDFDEATVTAAKGSSRVSLNWLDACGNSANIIDHGPSEDGKFIMSRKETATHLPRSKPYIIDESEWEYRDWCWPEPRLNDDYDTTPKYTNFVATAGQYDRNIGLGGNMEFTVYDDDEVAPVLGAEGNGLYLTKTGGVPDLLERAAGTRDFVLAGWSFTNTASAAAAMEVWSGSAEKENARLTCSANLGTVERLLSVGSGKGVTGVEFNGVNQVGNGELYFKCNTEGYNITAEDEAWIGFETDMESMTDREVSFWYATGSDGFKAGKVQVSTDGVSWEDVWELELDATTGTGGASTFAEFVGSLEYEKDGAPAIPRGVGHLWFRVVVSERKTGNGSFRMDCIQVRGTPDEVAVSDAALVGARPTFLARVSDPGSGLDEATAVFKSGLETVAGSGAAHTRSASLVDGGKDPASSLSWQVDEALTTDNVQKWFAASEEGGTHLKITVADADDDRAGDQTTLNGDFGVLRVYDDDEDPPEIKMTSMKPRTGNTLAAWCFGDKPEATAAAATKHANGLNASVLKARAGGGAEPPKPLRPIAYDSADASKGWGVYQSGWHFGTKYWYVRLETLVGTTGDDGAVFKINKISFDSKTGSTNSPTACTVSLVSGITAASIDPDTDAPADGTETTLGSLSLLPSGASAWTADTIKTWKDGCSLAVDITLDGNSLNELRIRGTGCADPSKGVGAPWYIHDLTVEGTVTYANGQTEDVTYVTDHALAGGASLGSLTGNAWDEKSGISEATYSLKRGGTTLVPTTALAFTGSMADAKSEAAGEFAVDLSGVAAGYNNVVLGDYTGSVEVWDADADRTSGGENVDRLKIDGDFGFTVVDQDVKGPTAPSGVAVNGVSMDSVTEPLWTNKPDFTITFAVAHDEAPTAEEMTANGWIDVVQDGVTGVGEYRVALADTDAGRAAASAYSVTVTNGAAGNGGFENATAEPWTCNVSGSGVQPTGVSKGGAKVTAKEGVNSFYLQAHTSANGYPEVAQILPLEVSGSDYTVDVDVTASVYKRGAGTIVYAQIQLAAATADFDGGDVMWTSPSGNQAGGGAYQFNTGSGASGDPVEEWLKDRALATKTITVPAGAAYMRFCLFANSAGANVDDVRLSVKKGAGTTGMMRYVATPEAQGLQNKFLYAVDADNDRRNDRMVGAAAAFHTAYDITAPTPVAFKSHGKGASTDQVDDPTTQFDLTWFSNDIGPDDPDDANYQTGWSGKDVLSPWGTYRVYYTTYDPVDMEDKASKAGKSTETYLYETLIEGTDDQGRPKYHGAGWKHVENGAEIEDVTAPAVGGKRKYSGWDQITKDANNQQTVRLYDLDFDQEYVVVVVGVDKAGNEGPVNANSWATNNTIKFSLTRGWHVPKAEAVTALEGRVSDIGQRLTNAVVSALEWTAAGMTRNAETGEMEGEATKDYDLLQWDARNFRESPDNDWKLLQTVKTNWFVDDGGPTNRGSIRFYRASYKDRWKKAVTNATTGQVTAQTPLVSEEVYAQTAVRLRPGENYTALHGVPYTNTFHAVFGGAEEFPGGTTAALGTTIDFFTPATNALAHETYWLRDDGEWMDGGDRPVGDVVQTDRNFFTRAFSINLPNELPEKYVAGTETIRHSNGNTTVVPYMVWKPILQVPTNGFSQAIQCGEVTAPVFNVVALRLPVAAHPSEMNLVESGFGYVEGSQVFRGDQIYTIDTITREPGHSCYCKKVVEDGQVRYEWRFVGGNGMVPAGYFKPNDVLVIVSKSGGAGESWTWTYNPKKFYTLPNRHMQAGE